MVVSISCKLEKSNSNIFCQSSNSGTLYTLRHRRCQRNKGKSIRCYPVDAIKAHSVSNISSSPTVICAGNQDKGCNIFIAYRHWTQELLVIVTACTVPAAAAEAGIKFVGVP